MQTETAEPLSSQTPLSLNGELIEPYLERLNDELREASAQTILRVALKREWPGKICSVSSFGAESAVLLALIADVDPGLPIVFLDTRMHFPQTLQYRDELAETLGLTNIVNIEPDRAERERIDPKNDLWKTDVDACCDLRKVKPLEPALRDYDAWITGRKRFHGGERMRLPVFEHAGSHFKVNPLAGWGQDDVTRFFEFRKLPKHALVPQGYPSIGCWPCTRPAEDPNDPRSGRWAGQEKSECGIHAERAERPRVF